MQCNAQSDRIVKKSFLLHNDNDNWFIINHIYLILITAPWSRNDRYVYLWCDEWWPFHYNSRYALRAAANVVFGQHQ